MDSIIFDLDGTLWDSREPIVRAWNEVLRAEDDVDEISEADLKRVMGLQIHEIAEKLFPRVSERKRKQIMKRCGVVELEVLEKEGGILYDDVEEVLAELAKTYRLFIVSNCRDGYIEAFFMYHGLGNYFTDYENPGRTNLPKSENIKLVMERNALGAPLYVGDTLGDQKAAQKAGIPFAFVSYGFGEAELYDCKLDSFRDLKQFL